MKDIYAVTDQKLSWVRIVQFARTCPRQRS